MRAGFQAIWAASKDPAAITEARTQHAEVTEKKTLTLPLSEFSEISKAMYGIEDKWIDVTRNVEQWVLAGEPFVVNNGNCGSDPAHKQLKTLKVDYLPACNAYIEVQLSAGKLVAYNPRSFANLRAGLDVDEEEYFASLTAEVKGSGGTEESGKSGELFLFTSDRRFVIKTTTDTELSNLLAMMLPYSEHLVSRHKDSLMTRYFGAYKFSPADGGKSALFIVMNNVFQGAKLSVMYDLKGTTEDRWVDPAGGGCLKDNNFAPSTVHTSEQLVRLLDATLAADTRFLESRSIMDYSLMVGVEYLDDDCERRAGEARSRLMGGVECDIALGVLEQATHRPCLVYLGMVDMLVSYTFKKRAAHLIKSTTVGRLHEIDTVPPDIYAERFRNYFRRKVRAFQEEVKITAVPHEYFVTPMPPMVASGGTAAFFRATLISDECPEKAKSAQYWIAKDLGRARDEVDFYEIAKSLRGQPGFELLDWMTPYKGVSTALCEKREGQAPEDVQVMLLRNGRDGMKTCRMLDIKIGWATAVAGWQGKTGFGAWQQGFVDGATNSVVEGFRLEGFDGPPHTLRSFESLYFDKSKLKRFKLQQLTAVEFMKLFLDLHDTSESSYWAKYRQEAASPPPPKREGDPPLLEDIEIQELVLLNCIEELAAFAAAARRVAAPQQWIGSSVMLAFDCSSRPHREVVLHADGTQRGLARVHIFDWGRSELNTSLAQDRLTPEEQAARSKYWGFYCSGIGELLFACCSLYVSRYWHEKSSLVCTMWDKDNMTEDDFIGVSVMELRAAEPQQMPLLNWDGSGVKAGTILGMGGKPAHLELSITEVVLPEPSRLRNAHAVRVHGGHNIPNMDTLSASDAFVEVAAVPEDAEPVQSKLTSPEWQREVRDGCHSTTLATNTEVPVFLETFQLATLQAHAKVQLLAALGVALNREGPLDEGELLQLFPRSVGRASGAKDLRRASGTKELERSTSMRAPRRFAQMCFPDFVLPQE